jgi:hypothetical protein
MGLGPILKSRVLREKLALCNETLMSRSEHTTILSSVDDEKQFFANAELVLDELDSIHDKVINAINNSEILELINCSLTRQQVWEMFFFSIKKTIAIRSGQ